MSPSPPPQAAATPTATPAVRLPWRRTLRVLSHVNAGVWLTAALVGAVALAGTASYQAMPPFTHLMTGLAMVAAIFLGARIVRWVTW